MKLSDKAKWGIRIAYNVLVSAMLVITGVLFAYECYLIYKSGPSPFTRASIAEAFSHISVMTYITISLVILGAGLYIFMPEKEENLKRNCIAFLNVRPAKLKLISNIRFTK